MAIFQVNLSYMVPLFISSFTCNEWQPLGIDLLIDWVKVLSLTRHKIGHFGDVLPSQSLGAVLKKVSLKQQKLYTIKDCHKPNQKNTQNAKPKQMHKN